MKTLLRLKNAASRLRLKNKKTIDLPEPENVPILIPQKALDAIKAEDAYEFVEAIDFPTEGTGGIYTGEYFGSIIDYLKEYPIPGSKDGHDSQGDDYYTIGGEIQNQSESSGVCYLRIMVPPEGWNSSNANLIRSLKAGIPELSLVADVEPTRGNDGKVYFTKELGRPRNDIVPEGAMEVTIGNSIDEKEVFALIEKGAIDMDGESTELVKNGKVFRKAAVILQSTSDKALAGRVLNAIAEFRKTKPKRRNSMRKFCNAEGEELSLTYDDVLEWLKNAIANNNLTTEKLVADLGMENKLRKHSDEEAVEMKEDICEALDLPLDTPAEDIVEAVEEILEEAEKVADSVVDVEANELAGGKKVMNAAGKEEDNPVYLYARKELKGLRGKKLNAAVEKLKDDPVIIALRSKQADTRVSASDTTNKTDGIREV